MVDGERLLFGFHGIWQGTAVLYDKKHQSRWLHITGECIEGRFDGRTLTAISGRHVQWREWLRDHPDSKVMQPHPTLARRYFTRRDARRGSDFFPSMFPGTIMDRDDRLELAALIYGVATSEGARAYPTERLRAHPQSLLEDTVGAVPIVLVFDRETGSTAGFDRRLDGAALELSVGGDGRIVDAASGSRFDADGFAVEGPLAGRRLTPLGMQSEWYGWFAAYPETSIWGE